MPLKQLLAAATTRVRAKAMPRRANAIGLLPEQSVAFAGYTSNLGGPDFPPSPSCPAIKNSSKLLLSRVTCRLCIAEGMPRDFSSARCWRGLVQTSCSLLMDLLWFCLQ
ncbi:hypothetical protein HaLaN_27069 [Haematococcus lacustris]|uniref:Uncharacterized protein n=1 Tax=Haematococcus lacustris TaxID=44745 RepID=A0A6A0A7E7_HAELA|nr:hypothetical protein HaLaN_27069 [Haematococcus lacustris]